MLKNVIFFLFTVNCIYSYAALDAVDKLVKQSDNEWKAVCVDDNQEYYTRTVSTDDILNDRVCDEASSSGKVSCIQFTKDHLHSSYYDSPSELKSIADSCSSANSSTLNCLKDLTSSLHSSYYDSPSEIAGLINSCK